MTRYPSHTRLGWAGLDVRRKKVRYGRMILNGIGKEAVSIVSGYIHRPVYPDRC
jgi:hypothetical protein